MATSDYATEHLELGHEISISRDSTTLLAAV